MTMHRSAGLLALILVGTIASIAGGQPNPPPPPEWPGPAFEPPHLPSDTPTPTATQAPAAPPPATAPTSNPPAIAPPKEPEFGDRGEYVLSGAFFLNFGHLGYSKTDASTTSVSIQPSFDYFIAPNYFMGGAIFLSHADTVAGIGVETNSITYGAYLHLGGNVPLGSSFSWRPQGSIGVWSQQTEYTAPRVQSGGFTGSVGGQAVSIEPSGTTVTETVVVAEIFAPFLLHPARHFFIGFGPDFYVDLSHTIGNGENNRTFIGASSIIGGWFGGEPERM